jgi:hypothetical protein
MTQGHVRKWDYSIADMSNVTVIVRLNLFIMTSLAYYDIDIYRPIECHNASPPRPLIYTNLAF